VPVIFLLINETNHSLKIYTNMKTSTCCGAPLWITEDPICSECKEHCDYEIIEDEPSN